MAKHKMKFTIFFGVLGLIYVFCFIKYINMPIDNLIRDTVDVNNQEKVPPNFTVKNNNKSKFMPDDIKKIIDREKLIVGVYHEDRPPFFKVNDEGELAGLDIDLAKNIAKSLGVKVEFNRDAKSFDDFTKMLTNGEIDVVISKFSRTYERAKSLRFSKPYINLKQALLVNKVFAVKNKLEDYPIDFLKKEHVNIGVIKGTSFVDYAQEIFKKAEIKEYANWDIINEKLSKGELVAAIYDDNEIVKMVRNNPEVAVYATVYVLKDKKDPICIAGSWESPNLIEWINAYLDTNDIIKDVNSLINEYPDIYKQN